MLHLKLSLDKTGLIAETDHGLEIAIEPGVQGYHQLLRMLRVQAEPKVVPKKPGITSDGMRLVLAEWERLPGEGNGKIYVGPGAPRDAAAGPPTVIAGKAIRRYTKTGRRVTGDLPPL